MNITTDLKGEARFHSRTEGSLRNSSCGEASRNRRLVTIKGAPLVIPAMKKAGAVGGTKGRSEIDMLYKTLD